MSAAGGAVSVAGLLITTEADNPISEHRSNFQYLSLALRLG